jgi:alpha-beta hydrolase superfamily lysophospholipase
MIKIITTFSFWLLVLPFSHSEEITFKHKQDTLSGHYLAATNGKPAKAILLFVHGDGAMTYNAEGYYDTIWETLRKNGYAVFSWDKPNIGNSSGNWLKQSMADRQSEVLAAIEFAQNKYHFNPSNTGLIGFSQAGWVLPALANEASKVSFIIGIGFATNWINQGRYYTKINRQLAGQSESEITIALDEYTQEISFLKENLSHAEYSKFAKKSVMTPNRYQFVLNNFMSDASSDYSKIKVPSLFLWGAEDLNVDSKQEFEEWQTHKNEFVTTKLIANANHGMLNSQLFDKQEFGFQQWIKLMWLGQDSLAPEFLPTVLTWLDNR